MLLAPSLVLAETMWVGPQLVFPVPAADVGGEELGLGGGLTFTRMQTPYVGIGGDIAFHHWPSSTGYRETFDRYLRRRWYQVIDSPTWAFRTWQATLHVRLVAPVARRQRVWVQAGFGPYRIDRNLAEPDWTGSSTRMLSGPVGRSVHVVGWNAALGFDLATGPRTALGLNANFHELWPEHQSLPPFRAFTVGAHFAFGL